MLEGNHMQTLKTTNAFLTFFFKKICNITGIVSSFLSDPLQDSCEVTQGLLYVPLKGFQHHHWGFKMMLIHLFFVMFEGGI